MPKLQTIKVLKMLDDFMFEQYSRCSLLQHAIKGMLNDEDTIITGGDIEIENHLNDMTRLMEHPQEILQEHIKHLESDEVQRDHGITDLIKLVRCQFGNNMPMRRSDGKMQLVDPLLYDEMVKKGYQILDKDEALVEAISN